MEYNPAVARLRGLCVLSVVSLHYMFYFPNGLGSIARYIVNGSYGVTVFFVISGFLITSNMIARFGSPGDVRFVDFYVMRSARIFPMLLLVLTIYSCLALGQVKGFEFQNVEALRTAVINKRAGGSGMISGRKAFQRPFGDGVQLLNSIQDVYLEKKITIA